MEGLQADYERTAMQFDNLFWRKITIEEGIEERINKIEICEEGCKKIAQQLQIMAMKEAKVATWVKDAFKKTMRRLNKQ